ncbi:MAG: hypothetical protein US63_C0026G0028 [Candidatus Moranbacteria bacterium GW2011_GWC2_37_8]|nr:MAG: hypothetical protein US63_C0026G0028 [Candidatus Moranbacteria bacterium GW2011_GWC2_37_8]KKQ62911.1 MAG: hypothetical protein US82_C0004G0028 [Parcubacteria group bacterium GW2011_GWC1_38_22]KKQ81242.1 MAG: hypothetical protein UT03_C0008G0038 [Candidatus Moranbacteria bacterium GW2011_GWD2_38_7]
MPEYQKMGRNEPTSRRKIMIKRTSLVINNSVLIYYDWILDSLGFKQANEFYFVVLRLTSGQRFPEGEISELFGVEASKILSRQRNSMMPHEECAKLLMALENTVRISAEISFKNEKNRINLNLMFHKKNKERSRLVVVFEPTGIFDYFTLEI